jgi:two-component system, sensor histidine kinase
MAPDGARRVLVIDDHDDSSDLVREVLVQAGHDVTVAGSGEAGLAALLSDAFDVAFVDVGLPGLDGYEIARRARARLGAQTPILVATTGFARRQDREAAEQAGFDLHLAKPVDLGALLDAVKRTRQRP